MIRCRDCYHVGMRRWCPVLAVKWPDGELAGERVDVRGSQRVSNGECRG